MKNILFIVYLTFGPGLQFDSHTSIYAMDMGTEQKCADEVERYKAMGFGAGRVGNLPGYRYVRAAWCEDRDAPWPGNGGVPLLDGSVLTQGPYAPRDKAERDRWTPLWTPWVGWSK